MATGTRGHRGTMATQPPHPLPVARWPGLCMAMDPMDPVGYRDPLGQFNPLGVLKPTGLHVTRWVNRDPLGQWPP